MSRRSPRKKRELQEPLIKKTESFQQIVIHEIQDTPKTEKRVIKMGKKLSINSENFVMHKIGSFDQDYDVLDKIGEGSFGSVYKVMHKTLRIERALKVIKKKSNEHFSSFDQIQVLKKLDHSNILKIFAFYEGQESYFLITEIFDGRQLFDEIVDCDKLDQRVASKVIFQILKAIHYTHSNGIAHRDIKPENIMVKRLGEKNMRIKIIDWGLGTLIGTQSAKRVCGTPQYCAPEVLRGQYSVSCDMWSLGVICYMMQTGQMLYRGKNTQETISIVEKGIFKPKAKLFDKLSVDSRHFMKSLLVRDPKKRMSAENALQHSWITKNNQISNEQPEFLKETLQRLKEFKIINRLGMAVVSFVNNHLSTTQERQKLDEIFHFLDKNGDGVLSSAELRQGYTKIYGIALGTKVAEETFNKLDINQNGTLDYSEFVAFGLKRQAQQQRGRLQQAFNLFDRNLDGKISWKEIGHVLQGRIQDLSEEEFMGIVKEFDQNGDGEIDFQEFIKCVEEIQSKINMKRSQDVRKSKDKSIDLMRYSK